MEGAACRRVVLELLVKEGVTDPTLVNGQNIKNPRQRQLNGDVVNLHAKREAQ